MTISPEPHALSLQAERRILLFRGQRVMLDYDLAELYSVETRALKQAVRRNRNRFPEDFLFELTKQEIDLLVSQNVIPRRGKLGGAAPMAFTEQGVAMLLSLLIYSHTSGVFSSRSIERATYDSVATRVLCGDTHPDHDTICAFRRENRELLDRAFSSVLEMTARVGVMKVGSVTVAIDGTKILANASKHAAASYEKSGEAMRELDSEIAALLKKAEEADSTPMKDGLSVSGEIARHQERKAKLKAARVEMEVRAAVRAAAERADYEAKKAERDAMREQGKKPRGKEPVEPESKPGAKDQVNFTDPESRIMPCGGENEF